MPWRPMSGAAGVLGLLPEDPTVRDARSSIPASDPPVDGAPRSSDPPEYSG